ncbi:cytosine permease [Thalassotalea litorea]|uniref:Cytosine permease n=1 Tax=Thalassotalea litorea TaxID=2020715 RepID=A0A5R9IF53_9GAMM|nr:cytosine permease [Thalassotalea litorea]TLU64155.1 cytosine permease [Thalassotalea litorea]
MPEPSNSSQLENNDYATQPVQKSDTVNGFKIAMINGSLAFSVPGLITGIEVGNAIGFQDSLIAFLIGGLFLAILGAITGIVGRQNRLTSCMTLKFVFGRNGADIISALFVLALLGWYGINLDLFSASLSELSWQLFSYTPDIIALEIVIGMVITFTTIFGFRMIEKISNWLVPVFIILLLYLLFQSLMTIDWQNIAPGVAASMSLSEAIAIVVGSFIVSVVLMPDFTRFARTNKDAVTASVLPFLGISSFVYIVSAIAGLAAASNDVLAVMLTLGLGSAALFLLIASSWITNVVNLYSAALGTNAIVNKWQEKTIIIAMGVIGTIVASMNLLDRFTDFLFGLSVVFTPVAAIYIIDFFVIRAKKLYSISDLDQTARFSFAALSAWLLGIAMAISVNSNYFTITTFEVVDALLIAALAYMVLIKAEEVFKASKV